LQPLLAPTTMPEPMQMLKRKTRLMTRMKMKMK
jgi:hypothetical protein